MPIDLCNDDSHRVLLYADLVTDGDIPTNQFLIVHGNHSAIIDPGGVLAYTPLSAAVGKEINLNQLDYVIASHQDPDIIASLDRWLLYTDCTVVISHLWERFLSHVIPSYAVFKNDKRIIAVPDRGMDVSLGDTALKVLPAHFLHSVGNFSFYDPVSRVLFSGDIGAAMGTQHEPPTAENFHRHAENMHAFHQRHMNSNRACRLWVNMVRELDIDTIAPQHGPPLQGRAVVERFLDWFEELKCGVDLITQNDYAVH